MDIRANFCFPPKTNHFQQEIRWNTFCTYWCELMRLEAFLSSSSERQTHIADSIKWNVIVIPYCSLWICIMYVLQLFNRSVWLFIQISDQRTGLTLSFYIQVDSVAFEYYTKSSKSHWSTLSSRQLVTHINLTAANDLCVFSVYAFTINDGPSSTNLPFSSKLNMINIYLYTLRAKPNQSPCALTYSTAWV